MIGEIYFSSIREVSFNSMDDVRKNTVLLDMTFSNSGNQLCAVWRQIDVNTGIEKISSDVFASYVCRVDNSESNLSYFNKIDKTNRYERMVVDNLYKSIVKSISNIHPIDMNKIMVI
jgi:hypothetical protein